MNKLASQMRRMSTALPYPAKQGIRLALRTAYWISTPGLMPARAVHLRSRYQASGFRGLADSIKRAMRTSSLHAMERDYPDWIRRYDTLSAADRVAIRQHVARFSYKPIISVVVPAYNTPADTLREMIQSVQAQLYPHWELCIADDASPAPHVAEILREFAGADHRIKWIRREKNGHISAASNTALELATGEFVALLDHDDLLPEHALYEVAVVLQAHSDAELIFSDEDKIDEQGRRYGPYFKPGYSYDLLLGQNLVSHLGVYRRSTLAMLGGFTVGAEGSQDYDLVLRLVHSGLCPPDKIHHIPAILYHWRQARGGTSFSQSQLDRCVRIGRASVQAQLEAAGWGSALVSANPQVLTWNRVRWPLPPQPPLVSIIIPVRRVSKFLRTCVEGILHRTDYPALELIIVDHESTEAETRNLLGSWARDARVQFLHFDGDFGRAALTNAAAKQANGEILLLLNDRIDVIQPDWLRELVSQALRPDIGVVGAKLLSADRRIHHAGIRLGAGRIEDGRSIAGHLGLLSHGDDPGYFGHFALTRDVAAVTGACLAIRTTVFQEVGGLDENHLAAAFNDIDLCLRVREAGYRVLWTPFAELFRLESASRGSDEAPEKRPRLGADRRRYIAEQWRGDLPADPFHNPNFDNGGADNKLAFPPSRAKPWLS
jgi:GT2 family glycosyltransferase